MQCLFGSLLLQDGSTARFKSVPTGPRLLLSCARDWRLKPRFIQPDPHAQSKAGGTFPLAGAESWGDRNMTWPLPVKQWTLPGKEQRGLTCLYGWDESSEGEENGKHMPGWAQSMLPRVGWRGTGGPRKKEAIVTHPSGHKEAPALCQDRTRMSRCSAGLTGKVSASAEG